MNKWVMILAVFFSAFIIMLTALFLFVPYYQFHFVTGKLSDVTGNLVLFIERGALRIFIDSPQNTTYAFSPGSQYLLDLNVSSPDNVTTWWYKLEDLKHNSTVNETVFFIPNTTFVAVRWQNKLTVFGNNTRGEHGNANVIFYINVPGTAPLIQNLSSQIYICEQGKLENWFNVTDPDEDDLQIDISPKDPFFVDPVISSGKLIVPAKIYSGELEKQHVGNYSETVFAIDSLGLIDTRNVNITVIEINNKPTLGGIAGTYTLYTRGVNSTADIQAEVGDVEGGIDIASGNFSHNLTFLSGAPFFNFTSQGFVHLVGNDSLVGVYTMRFCVTDNALPWIHPNISLCIGETGTNQSACKDFSITITNENRPPSITTNYPSSLMLNVSSCEQNLFNVTTFDPDGTIPDIYWYVDTTLVKYQQGFSNSSFSYIFGHGVSGNFTFKSVITDGLLNDSLQWNVSVNAASCPGISGTTSGGGGPSGVGVCAPTWGCGDWNVCQNTEISLKSGVLGGEDYRSIRNRCLQGTLSSESCGFQIRQCQDVNSCLGTFINKPEEIIECQYTQNPSCSDGIKNCHDGKCEFLVDCGGPCSACPTCSDGIRNQGELGIDCGGPCPNACAPARLTFVKKSSLKSILLILNLLLLLVIIIVVIRIILKYIRSKVDAQA